MSLQISERVRALGRQAQQDLREQFDRIDAIAEENSIRVLEAFQDHRVAEGYFAGTTGYGYDDLGRDKLDEIYAQLFGTEAALVRIQFVNGTHAIACALYGALKTGDVLVSAVGAPYDTLLGVIGETGKGHGSLKDYGVEYRQVELKDNKPDLEGMARAAADPRVKAVLIQRSKGYSTRASLSVAEIGEMCRVIREANPNAAILVDNCYGEFVETMEPTHVGADLVVGSLIKNPGGGLAPTGGYIAGRRDLVEGAAQRLTVPGIGGECGSTLGNNRLLYQGALPIVDDEAFADALFATFGCLKEQRAEAADDRGKASQPYRGEEALLAALQAEPLGMEALRQLAEDHAPAGDTFTWLMIWLAEAQRDGLIAQYPDGRYGPHPALRTAV